MRMPCRVWVLTALLHSNLAARLGQCLQRDLRCFVPA